MAAHHSTLGDLIEDRRPVSMPTITLPDHTEAELREVHQSFSEKRVIRAGRDAWEAMGEAVTFENWKRIGAALEVGKQHTLRVTGANAPWGRVYTHHFSKWMQEHGFGNMRKSDRSHAIELSENLDEIEKWRATLPAKRRKRLKTAQSNVKAWKGTPESPCLCPDKVEAAEIAWRRFCLCVQKLPPDNSPPYWQRIGQCVTSISGQ